MMRSTLIFIVLYCFSCNLFAQGIPASEYQGLSRIPVCFSSRGKIGDEHKFKVSIKELLNGSQFTEQCIYYTQKITDKNSEGSLHYAIIYNRFIIRQKMPFVIEYDSIKNPPSKETAFQSALVGSTVTFWMDRYGNPYSFTGFEEVLKKAEANIDKDKVDLAREQFDALLASMRQSHTYLPNYTLKPGSFWSETITTEAPGLGELVQKLKYWYLGVQQKKDIRCAKIYAVGEIDPIAERALKQDPTVCLSISDGSIKGAIFFSLEDGNPVESQICVTMKLTVSQMGQKETNTRESIFTIEKIKD